MAPRPRARISLGVYPDISLLPTELPSLLARSARLELKPPMTLQNAIAQVKRDLPSEMRIYPGTAPAVRELLTFAESRPSRDELIDAITNLIDEGIRKQRFGLYEEWRSAVEKLLTDLGA